MLMVNFLSIPCAIASVWVYFVQIQSGQNPLNIRLVRRAVRVPH